jgi:hypothetical protein
MVASGGMTVIPKIMNNSYLVTKFPKTEGHGKIPYSKQVNIYEILAQRNKPRFSALLSPLDKINTIFS